MRKSLVLMWLIYLSLSAPVLNAACTTAELEARTRLKIPLFQYGGAVTGEALNQYSSFQTLLNRKFTVLIRELQKDQTGLAYLDNLGLYLQNGKPLVDDLSTPAKRQEYWSGSRSLELLRGEVVKHDGQFFALSDIYMGDLGEDLGQKEIVINLPIVAELVPTTNDSHSLVTYYLLAMDVKQLGCGKSLINYYLSKAWSIYQDLAKRDNGMVGDLKLLEGKLQQLQTGSP